MYAMCAMRHMHEFGTTSEQLAWVKVAASHHARHNPHAMLRELVTVEDVVGLAHGRRSAAPARLLRDQRRRRRTGVDAREMARSLARPLVGVIGAGEAVRDSRAATSISPSRARPGRARPHSRRPA